jgi:hypothetical protein
MLVLAGIRRKAFDAIRRGSTICAAQRGGGLSVLAVQVVEERFRREQVSGRESLGELTEYRCKKL